MKYFSMQDRTPMRIICAFAAGVTACVIGSPMDVIKTRLMNKNMGYTGFGNCISRVMREEGAMTFYAGFTPNCMRLALFNVVIFLTFEEIKDRFFVYDK